MEIATHRSARFGEIDPTRAFVGDLDETADGIIRNEFRPGARRSVGEDDGLTVLIRFLLIVQLTYMELKKRQVIHSQDLAKE